MSCEGGCCPPLLMMCRFCVRGIEGRTLAVSERSSYQKKTIYGVSAVGSVGSGSRKTGLRMLRSERSSGSMDRIVRIPGSAEAGYGEHIRTWIVRPHSERLLLDKQQPAAPSGERVDSDSSQEESSAERQILSADPAQILLNLTAVTSQVLSYLPIHALRACAQVCKEFRYLTRNEVRTRNAQVMLVSRGRLIQENGRSNIRRTLAHLDNERPNDACTLFLFHTPEIQAPRFAGGLKDGSFDQLEAPTGQPDASQLASSGRFKGPLHPVDNQVVLGLNIFVIEGKNPIRRDQMFAGFFIPALRGFYIRKLILNIYYDYALRIGHFNWFLHALNDLNIYDRRTCEPPKGVFLNTVCNTLGMPESYPFDLPFCGSRSWISRAADHSYIFCGARTQCASIWLDRGVHRGDHDEISREIKKIQPELLQKDAVEVLVMFFTTERIVSLGGLPLGEHGCLQEEVQVFREFFPGAKMIGCPLASESAVFGNTASSVCRTSELDRTVRVAAYSRGASSRKSLFFVIAVGN